VKPKISDMKIPNEADADKKAEVEQHNREFEQRYDRVPKAQDDKVDKKFWSGEFEIRSSAGCMGEMARADFDFRTRWSRSAALGGVWSHHSQEICIISFTNRSQMHISVNLFFAKAVDLQVLIGQVFLSVYERQFPTSKSIF
jgi:hypothetical protein